MSNKVYVTDLLAVNPEEITHVNGVDVFSITQVLDHIGSDREIKVRLKDDTTYFYYRDGRSFKEDSLSRFIYKNTAKIPQENSINPKKESGKIKTYKEIRELWNDYTSATTIEISNDITLYIDKEDPTYKIALQSERSDRELSLTLEEANKLMESLKELELPNNDEEDLFEVL